jgi:hypothetical protein
MAYLIGPLLKETIPIAKSARTPFVVPHLISYALALFV